tara:strand:- start:2357 stop:2494 length:138 start_codon:yes stop_codon:yes gene_type:complete
MVNNYNLEYQLLKKSNVTNRAPTTNSAEYVHIPGYDECKCCVDTE